MTLAGAQKEIQFGPAADTIRAVAGKWEADLVVVGSHGKGWVDRLLLGSVTEQLLNGLPTSLLVVPVPAPGVSKGAAKRQEGAKHFAPA